MQKERVILTAENKQVKHGLSILKLLEAVQFPNSVAVIRCRGHQKGGAEVIKGNKADATAKRAALEPLTWQLPLIRGLIWPLKGQIHTIIPQFTQRKN